MNIKLIYFNFAFWRAEISRIALFSADIPFEDYRVTSDDFAQIKATGALPDGTIIPTKALPCLNVDDVSFCQTGGIARFCGKLSGLYPSDNEIACAIVDQVVDICTDITTSISYPPGCNDDTARHDYRKSVFKEDGKVTKHLLSLNRIVEMSSSKKSTGAFITEDLTIGDLAIWGIVKWLKSGLVDFIDPSAVDKYTCLIQIFDQVAALPKVKEWQVKTKF